MVLDDRTKINGKQASAVALPLPKKIINTLCRRRISDVFNFSLLTQQKVSRVIITINKCTKSLLDYISIYSPKRR